LKHQNLSWEAVLPSLLNERKNNAGSDGDPLEKASCLTNHGCNPNK